MERKIYIYQFACKKFKYISFEKNEKLYNYIEIIKLYKNIIYKDIN